MSNLDFLNLDLLVEPSGERFVARILDSPSGESDPVEFDRPFTGDELLQFFNKIGQARIVQRSVSEFDAVRMFGATLYEAVFSGSVQNCLVGSLARADDRGVGLRVRIRLTRCPELADLPWEYLYDRRMEHFLCLSNQTPIVRYLELPAPQRPLRTELPLNILAAIASPSDLAPIDADLEFRLLHAAVEELVEAGLITVAQVEQCTLSGLQRALRRGEYHVLHFIGHGGFSEEVQDGLLALEDVSGKSHLVSSTEFSAIVRNSRSTQLVILNSCEGARGSRSNSFHGVAQRLIRSGVPAVIAMQFTITNSAAIQFADSFYSALADGYGVESATTEGRTAIFSTGNKFEWASPVVYLRSSDGYIFTLRTGIAPPTVTLQKNDRGKAVRSWQQCLLRWRPGILSASGVDGVFGRETYTETVNFQRWAKLPSDGVVGKSTSGEMSKLLRQLRVRPGIRAIAERWNEYGIYQRTAGRSDLAVEAFDQGLRMDPESLLLRTQRAVTYRGMRRFDEALADHDHALAIDPGSTWARVERAVTYREMRRFEEALADLDRSVAQEPDSAWVLVQRATTFREMRQFDDALSCHDQALHVDRESAWVILERGVTYREMRRFVDALADCDRALELEPNYNFATCQRALVLRELGRNEEAFAGFSTALKVEPDSVWILTQRAMTLRGMEKSDGESVLPKPAP